MTLTTAHFQLTGCCNLTCKFCGQNKGMLACADEDALPLETWFRLGHELKAAAAPERGTVMLWGGEPLLYEHFDELAEYLHGIGLSLQVVTNGTLINQHCDALNQFLDIINISVDGTEEIHDTVRNPGVYAKLRSNIPLLKNRKGKLIFLTTISDANVNGISQLPYALFEELHPDEIILQPLMYLNQEEIDNYRQFCRDNFGRDYPELQSWHRENADEYQAALHRELSLIKSEKYPLPVRFTPHSGDPAIHCRRPWYFVHVRHDGEVGFCTDYFGFSAGNVRNYTLDEIFNSERARTYRNAIENNLLTTCKHCPWRLQNQE